jgi:hypothetical protein
MMAGASMIQPEAGATFDMSLAIVLTTVAVGVDFVPAKLPFLSCHDLP